MSPMRPPIPSVLALVALCLLCAAAPGTAPAGDAPVAVPGTARQVEAKRLHLSIRIAETKGRKGPREYYRSLARRSRWRSGATFPASPATNRRRR